MHRDDSFHSRPAGIPAVAGAASVNQSNLCAQVCGGSDTKGLFPLGLRFDSESTHKRRHSRNTVNWA